MVLTLLLVMTFAFGGSARGDEFATVILRPVSAIALFFSLYLLKNQHLTAHRFWSTWLVAVVALTAIHLIPLPPSLWRLLPGRELAIEVDTLLSASSVWRPISLSPELTRNALWSMMTPLACFFLLIQLNRQEVILFLSLLLLMGFISGIISVLQISQGPQSVFYFYRIANFGSGVGFFANRNHQAVLLTCLVPMGYGLTRLVLQDGNWRPNGSGATIINWIMALGAVFVFSLVMVTGSRAGLLLYGVAIFSTFVYSISGRIKSNANRGSGLRPLVKPNWELSLQKYAFIFIFFSVVIAVLLSGRADTLVRLADSSADEEVRLTILDPLISATLHFMPIGSGIGSFDPVFRSFESTELLSPLYWNHAHNDWLEIALTGGVPALLLVAVAISWIIKYYANILTGGSSRKNAEIYSFIGGSVLTLIALSSVVEYPLRVPIMSCIFVFAVALISMAYRGSLE